MESLTGFIYSTARSDICTSRRNFVHWTNCWVRQAAINPKWTRAKKKTHTHFFVQKIYLFPEMMLMIFYIFFLKPVWKTLHRCSSSLNRVLSVVGLIWDFDRQSRLPAAMLMTFVRRCGWKLTRTFWLIWCSVLRILSLKFFGVWGGGLWILLHGEKLH